MKHEDDEEQAREDLRKSALDLRTLADYFDRLAEPDARFSRDDVMQLVLRIHKASLSMAQVFGAFSEAAKEVGQG